MNTVSRLIRCARLTSGAPRAVSLALSGARDAASTVVTVLAPLVNASITPAERQRTLDSLHLSGARFSYLTASYARMSGTPNRPDLAVLAGAFSRLYDDLFDEISDLEAQDRLGRLFRDEPFTPATEYESLLQRILLDISDRMDQRGRASMLAALDGLHRYQQESRRQSDPQLPPAEVFRICRGKGAMAATAFFRMLTPDQSAQEQQLIPLIGRIMQSIDDLADRDLDRQDGITTPATLGLENPSGTADQITVLGPLLLACYGRPARQFVSLMYLQLLVGVTARRLREARTGGLDRVGGGPFRYLMHRSRSAVPPSERRAQRPEDAGRPG